MMNGEDWRRLLTDVTGNVQSKVSKVIERGEVSKAVGVGASGDTTLVADKEAENELLGVLTRIKELRIVSEEAGNRGDIRAPFVAIVDPLDGSSNFEKRIPFYCTSVAVAKGDSLTGISWALIRNLTNGDVYWAEKGKGSSKNGSPLRASKVNALADSVVGVDLSRGLPEVAAKVNPLIASVKRQVHFGANALELCFLAEGKIDAFVDLRMKMRVTDFAAAYLIASEAGAVVTDEEGSPLDARLDLEARFPVVGAGNGALHRRILRVISS